MGSVHEALRDTANIVQSGFAGIGNSAINREKLALQGAELGFKRQQYDEQKPLRDAQLIEAKNFINDDKRLDEPATFSDIFGQNQSEDRVFHIAANDIPGKVAKVFNAEFKGGKFMRKGQPVTKRMVKQYANEIAAVVDSATDPMKLMDERLKIAEEGISRAGLTGAQDPSMAEKYEKMKAARNDPATLLQLYEAKRQRMSLWKSKLKVYGGDVSTFDDSIQYIDKKIAGLKGAQAEQSKRAFELKKIGVQHNNAVRLKGIEHKFNTLQNDQEFQNTKEAKKLQFALDQAKEELKRGNAREDDVLKLEQEVWLYGEKAKIDAGKPLAPKTILDVKNTADELARTMAVDETGGYRKNDKTGNPWTEAEITAKSDEIFNQRMNLLNNKGQQQKSRKNIVKTAQSAWDQFYKTGAWKDEEKMNSFLRGVHAEEGPEVFAEVKKKIGDFLKKNSNPKTTSKGVMPDGFPDGTVSVPNRKDSTKIFGDKPLSRNDNLSNTPTKWKKKVSRKDSTKPAFKFLQGKK